VTGPRKVRTEDIDMIIPIINIIQQSVGKFLNRSLRFSFLSKNKDSIAMMTNIEYKIIVINAPERVSSE